MSPWLVLVSLVLGNAVTTCKIGSFLCSLDNLLQKNVIVFFFGNQISKWRSFEKKKLFLTYFSHFLQCCHQGKVTKIPSAHFSNTYLLTLLTCFALPIFKKNTNLSGTVSLWYESWC